MSKNKMRIKNVIYSLWCNLDKFRKFQLISISFIMVLSSLSEVFCLTAVIPYISVITNPNKLNGNSYLFNLFSYLNFKNNDYFILLISFFFIGAVIFSAILRIINLKLTTNLAANIGNDLSYKVFKRVLNQPYSYHLKTNSGETIAAITNHIQLTVISINFMLQMLTAIFITFSLTIGLLFINFKITIFSFLIISIAYIYLAINTKNRLLANSNDFTNASKKQVITVQEGLGTIRDIILNNSQKIYLKKYNSYDQIMRKKQANSQFIKLYPRHAIEALGITLIAISGLLISRNQADQSLAITTIGTIAIGSQKLLPSAQQIFASLSGIRGNISSIENVINILKKENIKYNNSEKENLNIDKKKIFHKFNSIELKNIFFKYDNGKDWLIKDFNLKIKRGNRIGIVGTTGSGKSTILDIIMGLIEPNEGKVLINDVDIFSRFNNPLLKKWQSIIGNVPQMIFLADTSFVENIALGEEISLINMKKVIESAKKAKIHNFIKNTRYGYKTSVGERGIRISGGQRQRIAIARALYKNSQVLIFDEATSALDTKTEREIINSINSLPDDLTIITIAHRLSTLEGYDIVIDLSKLNS